MTIQINNIFSGFGKIFGFVAKHFVISFVVAILFAILLANFVFYNFYVLGQGSIMKFAQGQLIVNDKSYNELLKIWEEQDKRFQDSETKQYLDFLNAR